MLLIAAAEEALADPYFAGLSQPSREPSAQPISKLAFEFERRKLVVEEVRGQLLLLLLLLYYSCCCSLVYQRRLRPVYDKESPVN